MTTKFTCKIVKQPGRVDLIVDTPKGTHYHLTKIAAFKLAAKAEQQAFESQNSSAKYAGVVSVSLETDTRGLVTFETMGGPDDVAAEIIALTISAGKR